MTARPRRVRIELAYDGTDFAGWQVQPGQRTVQGAVEQVLARLQGGRQCTVRGAGRTDAGVHARGQVADALVSVALDDAALERALSGLLPPDVRPIGVRTVELAFHSRKLARGKTYHYTLDRTRHGDPCRSRYALHVPGPLDLDSIREALAQLPGRRDWSGFTAAGGGAQSHIRHLTEARLETSGDDATFVFSGDGFLRYMVRNLVGTLIEIGLERIPMEQLRRVLDSRDRGLAGRTAAPRGLCLMRVEYGDEGGG